jgi:hypothetical protein
VLVGHEHKTLKILRMLNGKLLRVHVVVESLLTVFIAHSTWCLSTVATSTFESFINNMVRQVCSLISKHQLLSSLHDDKTSYRERFARNEGLSVMDIV